MIVADGRADFDLLSDRLLRPRRGTGPRPAVNLYVFDVLRHHRVDLIDRPWEQRRAVLETLDLAGASDGRARPVTYTTDGQALWAAISDLRGEGCCHKRAASRYRPGIRSTSWQKTKVRLATWFDVAGWRPATSARPASLLLAERGRWLGVANVALPAADRAVLAELLAAHGRRHPTGSVSIPAECLQAHVRYTSRTPTLGHLREPAATKLRAHSDPTPDMATDEMTGPG